MDDRSHPCLVWHSKFEPSLLQHPRSQRIQQHTKTMVSFLRHATLIFLLQHAMDLSTADLTADNDEECCLCDDCDVVSNSGQPHPIATTLLMHPHDTNNNDDEQKITTCEDLAAHLLLYINANDEQCMEQREFFRDVCCTQDDPSSVLEDPSRANKFMSSWAHHISRQLVWSTSSSKPNSSYVSWSSGGSTPFGSASTFTNSLTQWASNLSNLFGNTPAGSNNQIINLPSPTTSLFQFPRPTPPTSFNNGGFFPRPTPPSPPSFSFPRPTPPTFSFPAPTPPTFSFPARPSPPTFTAPTGGGGSDSQAWVNAHNTRRSLHHRQNGVSFVPIRWSNELAQSANAYTQRLLNGFSGCNIQHNFQGDSYGGENLALQVTQSASSISAENVLRLWYEDEIGLPPPQNGHLTQVVWRSTEYVGCASGSKRSGSGYCHIQTCRYLRPGNCNGPSNLLQDSTPCGPECPIREGCF